MAQVEGVQIRREFEQPADAISFYSDLTQVIGSANEILMQFYETIPGPPGSDGQAQTVKTRLRATVMVSRPHAGQIAQLLLEHVEVEQQE
jgi:hypothetical protein